MNKVFCGIILLIMVICTACGSAADNKLPLKILETERSVKNNVYLEQENVGGLKESEIRQKIEGYSTKINMGSKDARLDELTWEVAEKEQNGKKVNVEKTMEQLFNANEGDRVILVTEEVKPDTFSEKLHGNVVEIGSYSTPLLDNRPSRVNNIELASQKLNYKIILPGEEFSFNDTIGRRTQEKGYESAPIIIKTEEGPKKGYGIGGGICQLSTTLYNAVNIGGLEVTERHLHSRNVGYVPKGKDATVAYDSVDFKFRNNKSNPVMICTNMTNNTLNVRILENRNQSNS